MAKPWIDRIDAGAKPLSSEEVAPERPLTVTPVVQEELRVGKPQESVSQDAASEEGVELVLEVCSGRWCAW